MEEPPVNITRGSDCAYQAGPALVDVSPRMKVALATGHPSEQSARTVFVCRPNTYPPTAPFEWCMVSNPLRSAGDSLRTKFGGSTGLTVLLLGAVLFFIPEPITSILGGVLVVIGLLVLLVGRAV